MSIRREHWMVVLCGLIAGCEDEAKDISAEPVGSASEPVTAAQDEAKPKPSAVGASEVTPKASGSAKEQKCSPGGCAPGKCG